MPPFVPYPKIVDRIAAWNADETDRRALDKQIWVASEKIHGANLCICTDGAEIAVAKRRAVLDAGDPFFGSRRDRGQHHGCSARTARCSTTSTGSSSERA